MHERQIKRWEWWSVSGIVIFLIVAYFVAGAYFINKANNADSRIKELVRQNRVLTHRLCENQNEGKHSINRTNDTVLDLVRVSVQGAIHHGSPRDIKQAQAFLQLAVDGLTPPLDDTNCSLPN